MLNNSLTNQVWARGSRLKFMQYRVSYEKSWMNSSNHQIETKYFRLMIRQYFISLTVNREPRNFEPEYL